MGKNISNYIPKITVVYPDYRTGWISWQIYLEGELVGDFMSAWQAEQFAIGLRKQYIKRKDEKL